MMKSYVRYEPTKSFGVIASVQCNVTYDWSGNIALTGAGDSVSVWNVRQGTQISSLINENRSYPYTLAGEVNYIAYSPDRTTIAAGYSTGEICIFQYLKSSAKIGSLRGHQTGISCLAYDQEGTLLASGGKDSDIVIWDTVSLTGQSRLRGHKDAVTGVAFLPSKNGQQTLKQFVVSVSKDTLLKVWDVSTQHCIQTIVGHRCEIWSLALSYHINHDGEDSDEKQKKRVIMPTIFTGAADDLLRCYTINIKDNESALISDSEDVLTYSGCVKLNGGEKCTHIEFNSSTSVLAALSGQKIIELFHFRSPVEAKKKMKRRLKRLRERLSRLKADEVNDIVAEGDAAAVSESNSELIQLSDCVDPFTTIRCSQKIKSFSISRSAKYSTKARGASSSSLPQDALMLSLVNNSLEFYSIVTDPAAEIGCTKKSVIELQGHRSDVRRVAVSPDGLQIASCSSDGVRIWSSVSFQCLRRCPTGYGVSIVFAPGGRFVIVGTREGRLQVVDCASGDMTVDIEAHDGAIWSLAVHPDGKGLVTGSADHFVKFWEFGVENGTLSLTEWREMEMTHDVLCVRFSPSKSVEKSLVAVGLLDSTIKVFFNNTMKFFLSLYGHKLSVMCLDISYDGNLLISGSADKTIKIWGLDFGDCHRSLLGHEDSVTAVRFQPETHYFFSCGKDGVVKYWDADRFQQILNLPGHFSCVWSLDVPLDGSYCVSGSQDRSLRVWKKGEDLVFIEEEKERAFEAAAENSAAVDITDGAMGAGGDHPFSAVGTVQTVDSLKSGERLLESIDLVENELADLAEGPPNAVSSNPLLLKMTPVDYLLHTLRNIRSSDLEQALLVLPFHYVIRLIRLLCILCEKGCEVELVARSCLFLFRAHQPRIMSTGSIAAEVAKLSEKLRENLSTYRRLVGTNMAALRFASKQIEETKRDKFSFLTEVAGSSLVPSKRKKTNSNKKRKMISNDNQESKKSKKGPKGVALN